MNKRDSMETGDLRVLNNKGDTSSDNLKHGPHVFSSEETDENSKSDDLPNTDDILQQLGGCGRLQIMLVVIIQSMKFVVCWGMTGNSFLAYVPDWRCVSPNVTNTSFSSNTSFAVTLNGTVDDGHPYWNKRCKTLEENDCQSFEFDPEIRTIVSEFGLVCDLSWVTATITSLQMAGMCLGSLIAGQMSDILGRKIPTFTSLAMLFVFQLVAYFSTSWVMFAVCKFFIGIGSAFFLTLYGTLQSEYALSTWRSIIISFPSWALESSLFALAAWQLQNWKHLTLIIVLLSALYMATWLLTLGYVAYGINFGIKQLSGNIYLNILIFSLASIPSKLLSMYLQNRFGRKKATIFFFSLCFVGGIVVGIAQYVDVARDQLTLYFALLANLGVDGAWGPVQTHEVELYPTVIRNTAFGFHSIFSRLGAVIGPQFVYLGEFVPGLLYFVVAGLSFLTIIGTFTLPETMNTMLIDNISGDMEKLRKMEKSTTRKIV